jgi:hypothetical protein
MGGVICINLTTYGLADQKSKNVNSCMKGNSQG